MNQFSQKLFGRLAELADAYALGAYDFGHESSTLSSPTTGKIATVVKQFAIKVTLQSVLHCMQRVAKRGQFGGSTKTSRAITSLRIDRQNVLFCNTAINKPLIYTFFKVLLLAILQVVLQQMQHIQCNVSVLQSKTRRCSHYVR